MKILIIEDEANIAQVLRLYLEQASYTVLIASDGVAGLELHAREHPDLVILDLMLPALDGMEVCRRIRAWANTPILMLTARQGEEDRIAGLELGADDYLVKPFSPREVVSRVKAILRRTAHYAPTPGEGHENGAGTYDKGKKVDTGEELHFRDLYINVPARRVEIGGVVDMRSLSDQCQGSGVLLYPGARVRGEGKFDFRFHPGPPRAASLTERPADDSVASETPEPAVRLAWSIYAASAS